MEKFYSRNLNCMVQQISKPKARRLYENGESIYLLPSSMRFDNVWEPACEINKSREGYGETFDKVCNAFRHYNCDNYRGRYIRFYVKC